MNPSDINLERLKLALRASNEGIWQWQIDTNLIEYSERVSSSLGYPHGQAPHFLEHLQDIYHPDDAVFLQNQLDSVFAPHGEEVFAANCRYNHPDGQQHWLRIRGACVRNEAGVVIKLAGSIIDITRRKNAETALEEERYRLKQLTESIPVNIYFKDEESRFVMANSATSAKMGLSNAEELIGMSDHDFFDVSHADKSRKDEVMIMFTQEKRDGELGKELWEGQQESWCITSKYPWLDHKGKVKGTFGVTNDVSDMVNTQDRLVNIAKILKEKNIQYEEELKLANEVQLSILIEDIPSLPQNSAKTQYHANFSAIYLPMSGVAGDFYEVISISDTKVGILMCDVMGHGIRASLIVAMLGGLINKEFEQASHADTFLYTLNQGLQKILAKAGVTMFATALYIVIDVETGELQMANAGHPLPLFKEGNSYQQIIPNDYQKQPALGLLPDINYRQYQVPLTDIDELILYTDGIYETANSAGEELEITGVIQLLESQMSESKHSIKRLIKSLRHYSHNQAFNDDVCVLSVAFENQHPH